MSSFAAVIHPLDAKEDMRRWYPVLARVVPTALIRGLTRKLPPFVLSEIRGVRSQEDGTQAAGWLVVCPLSTVQMLQLPPQTIYDKIVQAGRVAQRRGARLLGLGATASAVGDGGVTIAQRLNMPITTGRTLAVGLAVEALQTASQNMGLDMHSATAAVVGASGSVGLACAEMLAPMVGRLILVGRREIRLSQARAQAEAAGAVAVKVSTEISVVREADIVLSATSALQAILYPEHLKRHALVCDVALPPDVAPDVKRQRQDVSLIRGGIVTVPGPADLGCDLGLPAGHAYAYVVEPMILALEGRYESLSLGQRVHMEKVREITQLAQKHGFSVPETRLSRDDHSQ